MKTLSHNIELLFTIILLQNDERTGYKAIQYNALQYRIFHMVTFMDYKVLGRKASTPSLFHPSFLKFPHLAIPLESTFLPNLVGVLFLMECTWGWGEGGGHTM